MKINRDFFDKFNQLKKDFSVSLSLRLTAMEEALQDVMAQPENDERLQALHRMLHSLGGTAGSFGFTQLGLDARRIEGQIVALTGCRHRTMEDLMPIAKAVSALQQEHFIGTGGAPEGRTRESVERFDGALN